jgi:hypothetical protein
MAHALMTLILLPFKAAALLLELVGRTLAIVFGLSFFGIGALLCCVPLLIVIGAPLCLLSAVLVVKAL